MSRGIHLDRSGIPDIVARAASAPGIPAPVLTSLSPESGDMAGGTIVTATGQNFVDGLTFFVGAVEATLVTFISATEATFVTPSAAAGAVSVVVINPDTQSDSLVDGFTYTDPAELFGRQPVGWTVVQEFNNPATIPNAGSGGGTTDPYIEGSPNPLTGGTTYRSTSGYGDSPPIGGPAVAESLLPTGTVTGGGQGRFGMDLQSLNTGDIYIAVVEKLASDFPWSDNSNKAHQMDWGESLATQERMLISFRSRPVGSGGYDPGRDNLWAIGALGPGGFDASPLYPGTDLIIGSQAVTRGGWVVKEMLWRRGNGVDTGTFQMWVNGIACHNVPGMAFPDGALGIARRFYIEYVNNGIGGVIPNDGYRWVGYMRVATP